jgi:hypothetical protein
MITLTREEAQQVLDALEYNQANWQGKDKAIETLRARLSAPEPQREWQGLTDDEIKEILDCGRPNLVNIKKAEQKLKEKNT